MAPLEHNRQPGNIVATFVLTWILVLTPGLADAAGASRYDARECDKLTRQIERIHSRMRAGYSGRQGEKLAERLRELRRKRAKVCR